MRKKRLGEILHERGYISAPDLAIALQEQQRQLVHLGELLLEQGTVAKEDLISALEETIRVRYVDCRSAIIPPEVYDIVPPSVARRYCALPIAFEGGKLVVAMAEPQNLHTLHELRFLTGLEIEPRFSFRSEINWAIERYAEPSASVATEEGAAATEEARAPLPEQDEPPAMEFISASSRESNQEAMREFQADIRRHRTPAVRLATQIIAAAAQKEASDIHIEPQAEETSVRIRVDGVLRDLLQVPLRLQTSLVSRIKILADLDIAERRIPQDGRFLVQMGPRKIDVRVSTLPTQYGEKVVMRLLDNRSSQVAFEDLGFPEKIAQRLKRILGMPQGMLLVTGPTGSGKSTTLYRALNEIRSRAVNIVTVEDPIEYRLEGINQVQVNTKAGLTFASCLRSILRQDPNIILVGEIRDKETAEIAMKAAQTGHLVLSTLHTNDSVSALTRLLDLGIPGFLITASVTGILGQRLVRRLCACHKTLPMTPDYAERLLQIGIVETEGEMHIPLGCAVCDYVGYKGRVGIYELFEFDEQIRAAINSGTMASEIRALALGTGMTLMQGDALTKVSQGVTTMDEVTRVLPFDQVGASCETCGRDVAMSFPFCPWCGARKEEGSPVVTGSPNQDLPLKGRG